MSIKSIDLQYYHPEANSDKVYHLQIEKSGSGYVVNFQYGRRGSTLNTGSKTSSPVDLVSAEKVYAQVMNEKIGKGYQEQAQTGSGYVSVSVKSPSIKGSVEASKPGPGGVKRKILWNGPAVVTEKLIPQLLNPIDESEVAAYLSNNAYGIQPKVDGRHQIIKFQDGKVTVFNRKGIEIGYPKHWADAISVSCILDGEAINDCFHCFDLLQVMDQDLRQSGYETRYKRLLTLSLGESIKVVPLATGTTDKKKMYEQLKGSGAEGVVFKKLSSIYHPGKAHSDMWKNKFYSTASVRVVKGREGKRSIGMEVLDGNKWVFVGNCTVPPNHKELPPLGAICEIRYLYVQGKGGHLYQPVYLGVRDDIDEGECVISQLKYKSEEKGS